MLPLFIKVGVIDIIDILLVAFLMYQVYNLIKGTIATYIFITILLFYVVWLLVKDNMLLLGSILGQIIGVGAIAIIVVFQPGAPSLSCIVQHPLFQRCRRIF